MKLKYTLPILLFIVTMIATVAIFDMNISDTGSEKTRTLGASEGITINAPMPDTKEYPRYKVLYEDFDRMHISGFSKTRYSLPSEEEAIKFANKYIQERGGIPEDAYISKVNTQYLEKIDISGEEPVVVETYPQYVSIDYHRRINGLQVAGPGDTIAVFVGDDGEILYFFKTWRELEEIGNVEMISAEEATKKLKRGETIENAMGDTGSVEINKIEVGYYSEGKGYEQEFYEPVWIFRGVDSYGYNVTKVVKGVK